MSDHIGVFIDGRYLLRSGVKTLLKEGVPKVIPHRFNVLAFKNAVVTLVERLVPGSRILRIYWYECEAEAEHVEYRRRVILAKNGVKLRTFSHETDENSLAIATRDRISDDIQNLTNNGAISDALIVSESFDFDDLIDDIQAKGIHVHFVEIQRRELYLTLDLRAKVDTFSPWTTDSLSNFLLPNVGRIREDQDRILDPQEYDLPQPVADEVQQEAETDAEVDQAAEEIEPVSEWADEEGFEDFEVESGEFSTVSVETEVISPFVRDYIEKMLDPQIRACVQYWSVGRRDVPTTHDKSVLAACREGIQRNLTPDERKVMRDEFMRIVNQQFVERGLEAVTTKPNFRQSFVPSRFQSGASQGEGQFGNRFGGAIADASSAEIDEVAQTEITEYVEIFVAELNDDELSSCLAYWQEGQYGVPSMFDKGVMAMCRQELGRNLGEQEKYFMRAEFKRIANEIATERGVA
ncbi:MAG: NYN domain-containing protein [Gammaproteobacteria bacterium]|nr:NYN domain-containing protein [Gammaproteobacteria bacterium]